MDPDESSSKYDSLPQSKASGWNAKDHASRNLWGLMVDGCVGTNVFAFQTGLD